MPIYEYKCPSCRKVFEEWVKAQDTAPRPCPDCGTVSPHIVSNNTFVLKGGGWYVTEYGKRKPEGESSPSGGSAQAPSGGSAQAPSGDSAQAPSGDSAGAPPPDGLGDSAAPSAEAGSKSAVSPLPAAPAAKNAAASAA